MNKRELERRLRAIREPAPPPDLAVRLEQGIPDSARRPESWWSARRVWTMAKYGTLAAAAAGLAWVVVGLFTVAPGTVNVAFAEVLAPVLKATDEARAVHMKLRMLTREGEDFGYVNLESHELNPVEVWLQGPLREGDHGRARLEKKDRRFWFDGETSVLYFTRQNEAFKNVGFDANLFWPAEWVRTLQKAPVEGVEVLAFEEQNGEGRMVLRAKGVAMAPLEPAFFSQFDRETEIVWDLATHRLKGMRRWVNYKGDRRLFSELVSIEYRSFFDDAVFRPELPPDVRWGGISEKPIPADQVGLGPREIAQRIFTAAVEGDRATLEIYCTSPSDVDHLLGRVKGIESIGEPFHAGDYPGVFVPYEIRVKSGIFGPRTIKHQIALRNDNPQGRWLVDGGLP